MEILTAKGIRKMRVPTIRLSNGVEIPTIGNGPGGVGYRANRYNPSNTRFGDLVNRICNRLYRMKSISSYVDAVSHSFRIGFTLLDFSAAYGNEKLIGEAIKRSGVERSDLFLTTRVSNIQQQKSDIREQFFNTLKVYGTEYVDLYMFHWPVTGLYLDTYKQMEQLYKEGHCRAIGVANCHQHHLEEIFNVADVVPHINQVEIHPLFTQKPLLNYCKSMNIAVEAYTPIARFDDRLVRLPALKAIAAKHSKTVVQVVLRWHIQNGIIPIVRSLNKGRQLENISIFDFELTDEEMMIIDGFNINSRLRYDSDNCDFSIL